MGATRGSCWTTGELYRETVVLLSTVCVCVCVCVCMCVRYDTVRDCTCTLEMLQAAFSFLLCFDTLFIYCIIIMILFIAENMDEL